MSYTIGSRLLHADDRDLQEMAEQATIEHDAPEPHDHCPRCHNKGIYHTGPTVDADGVAKRHYHCMLCEHDWAQRWRLQ